MFGSFLRKMLTYGDVIWCFEHILGRHPRSPSEANAFLESCADFRDLVRKLVATHEFSAGRAFAKQGFVYDDSERVQRNVLAILKHMSPMRALDYAKIRIGKEFDGGYVMLDDFKDITAAYSIGIGGDVSWDLNMAERGIDVFQYDHTIADLPVQHPRFHWQKKGLGSVSTNELETLPRLLEVNAHIGRQDLLLKSDIEGCEWEVLASLPRDCLRHFKQIVLEIHYLERLADPGFATLVKRAISILTADHRVIHIHGNNFRPISIVGGIPVPSVLELSLVRADDTRMVMSDEVFPTPLDTPCNSGLADFRLGTFRF